MIKRKFAFLLVVLLLLGGILPAYAAADPLYEWHSRNPLTTDYNLNAVTYGNGIFVAVGTRGTILTSSDGRTWVQRASGITDELVDIAYGNGVFVAITYSDSVLTSKDGKLWTIAYKADTGNYESFLHSVNFANGWFHIAGDIPFPGKYSGPYPSSTIITTEDGATLAIAWDGLTPPSWYFVDVTYGNGQYVRVFKNKIVYEHGNKLKEILFTERFMGVSYFNNIFLAVGTNGIILTSIDGKIWTRAKKETSKDLMEIAYGNGTYIVVGRDGAILTSTDGTKWMNRSSGFTQDLEGIAYGNGTFVAVGESGIILQSSLLDLSTDKTPPVTTYSLKPIRVNEAGKKFIKGYTVTLTASDNLSGVKQTYYRINNGEWKTYSGPFEISGTGNMNLDFYSVDHAGNKETVNG